MCISLSHITFIGNVFKELTLEMLTGKQACRPSCKTPVRLVTGILYEPLVQAVSEADP
jgi:hypothetical protein